MTEDREDMAEGLMTLNGDSAGIHNRWSYERLIQFFPRIGIILAIAGSLLMAANDLLYFLYVMTSNDKFQANDMCLIEYAIHAFLIIPYLSRYRDGIDVNRTDWKFICFSGCFSAVAMVTMPMTVFSMAIANEVTMWNIIQIVILLLTTWHFLKEIPAIFDAVVGVLSIGSIILITQPKMLFSAPVPPVKVTISTVISSASFITSQMMIRYLKNATQSIIIAVHSVVGLFLSIIVVMMFSHANMPTSTSQWITIIAISAISLIAKICIITAMKSEIALHVVIVFTLRSVFSLLFIELPNHRFGTVHAIGITIAILVTVFIFIEKYLGDFVKNATGCSISRYDERHRSGEHNEESIALWEMRLAKDLPSLYSTD